jgi:hypothetical protein
LKFFPGVVGGRFYRGFCRNRGAKWWFLCGDYGVIDGVIVAVRGTLFRVDFFATF